MSSTGGSRLKVALVLIASCAAVFVMGCAGLMAWGRPWEQAIPFAAAPMTGGILAGVVALLIRRRSVVVTPSKLSEEERALARRAIRADGPVPADAQVRAEAVRLLRSTGSTGVRSEWSPVVFFAGAGVLLSVCGLLGSAWWFVDAAGFLLFAALTGRGRLTAARRMRLLVGDAGVPVLTFPDPRDEPTTPVERTARLRLHLRHPLPGSEVSNVVGLTIDGTAVPISWGTSEIHLPAGHHRLAVRVSFWRDFGRAAYAVDLLPNHPVDVHYSPPVLTFLSGRMGTVRQPRPGTWGLFFGAPVALAAFGACMGLLATR